MSATVVIEGLDKQNRERVIRCRVTTTERARLLAYARENHTTPSEVLRQALRQVVPDLSRPFAPLRREVIE